MITEELTDFADDFCRRISDLSWWAGAFQVVDLTKFSRVGATKPLPRDGRHLNLIIVTHTRSEDGSCRGRHGLVHHPGLEQATAESHLDDLDWVVGALAGYGLAV